VSGLRLGDLTTTYVHLAGTRLDQHVGDATFWTDTFRSAPLAEGWLVTAWDMRLDWDVWERHPVGDKLIIVLQGAIRVHLRHAGRTETVEVVDGHYVIVPENAWHTATCRDDAQIVVIAHGPPPEAELVAPGG
jgi:mannose-6-phosphate isomerase-like protein (cupin superfamily)